MKNTLVQTAFSSKMKTADINVLRCINKMATPTQVIHAVCLYHADSMSMNHVLIHATISTLTFHIQLKYLELQCAYEHIKIMNSRTDDNRVYIYSDKGSVLVISQ